MRVNYSAWSLLTGGEGSIDVTLDHPRVQLLGDQGHWRLPSWHGGETSKSKEPPPTLQVRLHVRGAELVAPAPCGTIEDVEFDVVANTGAETRIVLERMRYANGPWGSRLEALNADLAATREGVRVRVGQLRTPISNCAPRRCGRRRIPCGMSISRSGRSAGRGSRRCSTTARSMCRARVRS
jgi:hypothetical protein